MWTLVLWTVIAGTRANIYYGWQPMVTNLYTEVACEKAAKKLQDSPEPNRPFTYRCIGPQG